MRHEARGGGIKVRGKDHMGGLRLSFLLVVGIVFTQPVLAMGRCQATRAVDAAPWYRSADPTDKSVFRAAVSLDAKLEAPESCWAVPTDSSLRAILEDLNWRHRTSMKLKWLFSSSDAPFKF